MQGLVHQVEKGVERAVNATNATDYQRHTQFAQNLISQTKKAFRKNKASNFTSEEDKKKVAPFEEKVEAAEAKLTKHVFILSSEGLSLE